MSVSLDLELSGPVPSGQAPPASPGTKRNSSGLGFILVVFVVIAIAVATSSIVFLSLPRPQPSSSNIVFGNPVFVAGNVSFIVKSVIGGPYPFGGFRVNLVVNNFPGQSASLGPNESVVRISIGPNGYLVVWRDSDGDGAVSRGDAFAVSGDGAPLPSLSVYEFDLKWMDAGTAHAFWSTN